MRAAFAANSEARAGTHPCASLVGRGGGAGEGQGQALRGFAVSPPAGLSFGVEEHGCDKHQRRRGGHGDREGGGASAGAAEYCGQLQPGRQGHAQAGAGRAARVHIPGAR